MLPRPRALASFVFVPDWYPENAPDLEPDALAAAADELDAVPRDEVLADPVVFCLPPADWPVAV